MRVVRGLGSITPSYSTLWAAVGTSAWPVTVSGHTEACGSRPEWLGVVWPPGMRASLSRGFVYINSIGRGGSPPRGDGRHEVGPFGVERDGGCAPRVERAPGVGCARTYSLGVGQGGEHAPRVGRGESPLEGSDKVVS
jgi:hypothetical protein